MTPFQPSPELRGFVDRLLDGEALSKPESARLEELLEDDAALTYFLLTVQQDDLLPEALASLPFSMPPPVHESVVRISVFIGALAAAAAVAFVVGLFTGQKKAPTLAIVPPLPDQPASRVNLTGLVGVEWEKGAEPDLLGKEGPQRFALRTGLAELTYGNGVRVTIEGPADLSITGPNAARLDRGRLVAAVPKGAEGFEVEYAGGKVVDLGTEFGLETDPSGQTELGVFDGKVELHRPNEAVLSLVENQAVIVNQRGEDPVSAPPMDPSSELNNIHRGSSRRDDRVSAIPLDRGKFVRRIPTRDFRWELTSTTPTRVEFDVSHLVWKASTYRAIFKWMQGPHAVEASDVTLCLDGEPVSFDPHQGRTGKWQDVKKNLFELPVEKRQFKRGRWTLRATLQPQDSIRYSSRTESSVGILQFEEGLVTKAGPSDFVGVWTYRYAGAQLERHIFEDGTIKLIRDGQPDTRAFVSSRWSVDHGILRVTVPDTGRSEEHILRDAETLIFISQPYDNAKKISSTPGVPGD